MELKLNSYSYYSFPESGPSVVGLNAAGTL